MFTKHHTSFTAIEFDDDVLKIISSSTASKGKESSVISISAITSKNEDLIASEISSALKALRVQTTEVILSIPRHLVMTRYLELPSHDDAEIKTLIAFQIYKEVPHSPEEAVYDYKVLKKMENGFSEILAVIVFKKVLERQIDILKKASIRPSSIIFSSEAYARTFQWLKSDRHIPEDLNGQSILFISPDLNRTHAAIIKENALWFCRSMPIGISGLSDDEEWPLRFAREIELTINAFKKEKKGEEVWSAVVDGSDPDLCGALTIVSQKTGLNIVSVDSGIVLNYIGASAPVETGLPRISLSGITGTILDSENSPLCLMPPALKQERERAQKKALLMKSVPFGAAAVVLTALLTLILFSAQKAYLKGIENRISSLGTKAELMGAKKDLLTLLDERVNSQVRLMNILNEIYRIIPSNVSVSSISYERDKTLSIKGTCPDLSNVFDLIPELEKSPYFESVSSKYASKKKTREGEIAEFQIQCSITK